MNVKAHSVDATDTILGLDLGANSIGWCLLQLEDGSPCGVIEAGVRAFEAGVEGDIASGRAESRAATRRSARLMRRQTERRSRRKRKVFHILQKAGLLPEGSPDTVIPSLDKELLKSLAAEQTSEGLHHLAQVLPYQLRKAALDRKLEPYELGRALYHLCQRRGFKSNRKQPAREGEDEGEVKKAISELAGEMEAARARTLGEYFASLDPHDARIRGRWTSRQMYEDEFEAIWNAQTNHNGDLLTEDLKKRLHSAIFRQRPLKSAAGLVGQCELEPGKRRAPFALPIVQRWRLLQQVNNCRVITRDGEDRPFTTEEREKLIDKLDREGDLTFSKAKKLMGLSRYDHFTLEEGGEKRFCGNRTNAKVAGVLGDRWWKLSSDEVEQVVEDLRSFQNKDALARRAQRVWGLSEKAARKFAELELEPGYASFSRSAIRKLLPHLEAGLTQQEAIVKVYGSAVRPVEVHDDLPPLSEVADVRNPAVTRVLTELRKVVNGIIRKHGKPGYIRIELARDLRRNRKQRQETSARNRANERERKKAAERIVRETPITNPGRDDILKVRLADECDWTCPYTGKPISMKALLGENAEFDIEHIIPFSRSLDDSYLNKTLCYHEENRNVKTNHTPWEAYGSDPQRWGEILQRVKSFKGDAASQKLRRFKMTELEPLDDFAHRQLNDTRYASRLAAQYLACLYGGLWDESGTRRIQAARGGVTAFLREGWDLNRVLGDSTAKSRADHRQHAIDAMVVALTTPQAMRDLSAAAVEQWRRDGKRRRIERLPEPWDGFDSEVQRTVDSIVVSHRENHKVNGPLHKDTLYARITAADTQETEARVRKAIAELTPGEVEKIADPAVRNAVCDKLDELGRPPKQAFKDPANHPVLKGKNGPVPIHRVRLSTGDSPHQVGSGDRKRYAMSAANHHMEIVAVLDDDGNEKKWEGHVVSCMEAMRRVRAKRPVVQRDHGPNRRFKFSIAPGDTLEIRPDDGDPVLVLVRSVWPERGGTGRLRYTSIYDARREDEIKKDKSKDARTWGTPMADPLRKLHARKVHVSPIGEIRYGND
ncbi:MAG: type II CRISPR RNA-guided endonuclease Cas9 [Phycisphaerae bacterium]